METIHNGLEGILVAETELSLVDGDGGRLLLRGEPVEAVAQRASFEDTCHLMWHGAWPTEAQHRDMRQALARGRQLAFAQLAGSPALLEHPDGMDSLRACLASLRAEAGPGQAALLTGATGVFAVAWARRRAGADLPAPYHRAGHASDLLRMLLGTTPSEARARALDSYLSTVVDHGLNASTFAARVVTSTESDAVSAVVAGVGALKGRLHGGAPGPVLDMLDEVGEPANANEWVRQRLTRGERIMGMGHRVYRVRDPRGTALEAALRRLEASGQGAGRLALASAVEHAAETALKERHPDRSLRANVELFTAVLLEALGVERSLFTPLFASGRVAGWCAHIEEQRRTGRLIRPRARYVGRGV